MAFPTTDLMSSLSILKAGDRVDILVSLKLKRRTESATVSTTGGARPDTTEEDFPVTFDAMENAEIAAVVAGATAEAGKGATAPATRPSALLLAFAPQDALVVKNLKDAGAIIDIVLRAPTDKQHYETQPVDLQYGLDRFRVRRPLFLSEQATGR